MINDIKKAILYGRFEYSLHAVNQSISRHITNSEVLEAVDNAEIKKTILMISMVRVV